MLFLSSMNHVSMAAQFSGMGFPPLHLTLDIELGYASWCAAAWKARRSIFMKVQLYFAAVSSQMLPFYHHKNTEISWRNKKSFYGNYCTQRCRLFLEESGISVGILERSADPYDGCTWDRILREVQRFGKSHMLLNKQLIWWSGADVPTPVGFLSLLCDLGILASSKHE